MPSDIHAPRWRTPLVIVLAGCLIAIITFGPRSTMGFFLQPMSQDNGWSRDVFGLALAIQNLLWGAGQPIAGAMTDRFGIVRSLCLGAILYALGLAIMAYSTTPGMLHLSAGVLIGFGLSGASFNMVLSGFAKLLPDKWRSPAYGAGTAAGSFGQFLFSPLSVALIGLYGWQTTLLIFAGLLLLVVPLSMALAGAPSGEGPQQPTQSFREALSEAFGHRSYVLLVLGFFTCGFHVAFITAHLPPYLADKGLDAAWGGWVIALIGLFNIVGSIGAGYIAERYPKRLLLACIYFLRSIAFAVFLLVPVTPASALLFGAVIGLLWLSTVPPTSGLVALMFGTRYMATLFGFVFFSHQFGAFVGVWLGGILYERTGSYDIVWWLGVALGLFAALVHLPIREKPVERDALAPA
jgi:predicted MFS family arabinose efflux permease